MARLPNRGSDRGSAQVRGRIGLRVGPFAATPRIALSLSLPAGAATGWFQGGVVLHDLDILGDLMTFWVMGQLAERSQAQPYWSFTMRLGGTFGESLSEDLMPTDLEPLFGSKVSEC